MDGISVVTGGAGFIGSHLVENLAARGERIRVVEKPNASVDHLPPAVEIVRADIRDAGAVRVALEGARHVYHLAANPNLYARDRQEFEAVNHRGTIHVLDAAIAAGAARILHVSTESILTRAGSSGPIAEDIEVTESDAVGPYCLSKLRAENAAMARARAGHPVLVANPTMPVGPGDRNLSPPSMLIREFCLGKLYAYINCSLNIIDVRDAAEGIARVAAHGSPGRRYLLAGRTLSLLELLERLSSLTGVPIPRVRVPYAVGLAIAHISEFMSDWITKTTPAATVTGVKLTRRSFHFDAARSLAELNLELRPLDESLAAAVEWLVKFGQINQSNAPGRYQPGARIR